MVDIFEKNILISVITPIYNEENYIAKCIESLLRQDYGINGVEYIFVDGMSTDRTINLIEDFQQEYPETIKLLINQNKTVPYAMNIGIKAAAGEYIIRVDAHAEYPDNYISKCIQYLKNTDADNVGGIAETKSIGFVGNAIAQMLSSKFGVGNSGFRTYAKSGYVDTVPFGAFKKEVFEKYGFYDERLTRNQDNELNYRIKKNGGKIYLANDIKFSYYCRDSIKGIVDMAVKNGKWNIITMKLCPGSMGLRHFVPFIFLLTLLILPILSLVSIFFLRLLFIELTIYLLLALLFSIKDSKNVKYIPIIFVLFPLFHISYGFGSLCGIFNLSKYNITTNS